MLAAWRNPVVIITESFLVTHDVDVLRHLAHVHAVAVFPSVTTLNMRLAQVMEPHASSPTQRSEAIRRLAHAGIPTGVMVAPLIPGLTDHEMLAILRAAAQAGAHFAGYTILRLPHGVGDLFSRWLAMHYTDRKDKVLNKLRAMREGRLHEVRWHTRMRGEGAFAESLHALFALACRQAGLSPHGPTAVHCSFPPPG